MRNVELILCIGISSESFMQMIGDHVKELFGGMEGDDEMVGDGDLYGRMDWITEDHILIRLPLAVRKMLLPFTYLNRTRYLVIKESMQPSAAAINANDMT